MKIILFLLFGFIYADCNEIDMITIITGGTGSIKLLRGLTGQLIISTKSSPFEAK